MARAFAGVRVVDLTQVFAGPYATAMLASLGADVIKVEPPGGDGARGLLDAGPLSAAGMAPAFLGLNAGKRSLALDLKRPEAPGIVRRLVAAADVFVENARPGAMARLGLGYDDLRAVRPDLIYCSISGYGQEGSKRDAPAYDGAVQAASGMMSIGGEPGGDPLRVAFPVIDMGAGLTAGMAISSALYRRAMSGEGQRLDVAMFDTALSLMSPVVNGYLVSGTMPYQTGNSSLTLQPTTDLFHAADGALTVAALTEPQVRAFCSVVGRPDLLDDDRFRTIADQIRHRDAMRAELAPALRRRPRAEWLRALTEAGVPAGAVVSIPEAVNEPHVAQRRVLADAPGPDGRRVQLVNLGFEAGDDGPSHAAPAPRLGEHSTAVLRELGFDADEIAGLLETGTIVEPAD